MLGLCLNKGEVKNDQKLCQTSISGVLDTIKDLAKLARTSNDLCVVYLSVFALQGKNELLENMVKVRLRRKLSLTSLLTIS